MYLQCNNNKKRKKKTFSKLGIEGKLLNLIRSIKGKSCS
jgi:hypothetical protein